MTEVRFKSIKKRQIKEEEEFIVSFEYVCDTMKEAVELKEFLLETESEAASRKKSSQTNLTKN